MTPFGTILSRKTPFGPTRTAILVVACLVGGAVDGSAQNSSTTTYSGDLATMIPNVLLNTIRLATGAAASGTVAPPHDAHFNVLNDRSVTGASSAAATAAGVNRGLASQFATFPLGSSSGGFIWNFDEASGAYTRASQSFGPSFAERALTVGRNRFGLGFNYQHTTFDAFEGQSLDDGSIRFYLPHTDCCGPNGLLNLAFEGDVVEAAVNMKASSDTFTLFATYGLTDRWDVGVAIPVSSIDLDLTLSAQILRFSTQANPAVHIFPNGSNTATYETKGSATGLGDIVLRSKYLLVNNPGAQIAAAVDLRLPTGNADDLLGVGAAQGKVYAIISTGGGPFSQHFNVGYTFSGNGSLERYLPTGLADGTTVGGVTIGGGGGTNGNFPTAAALSSAIFGDAPAVTDEANFAAGVEIAATGRVTIIGDIIGRSLRGAGRFTPSSRSFTFNRCASSTDCAGSAPGGPTTADNFEGRTLQELNYQDGNLNQFYGTAGIKLNPGANFLVGASVLFPLTDRGLRSRYTTVIGVEYAF
jgi:hypothetical protein